MMHDPGHELAPHLLKVVSAVADELHPGRAAGPAQLDSRLDRDLAFDSLGRVELLARIERSFGVALPDHLAVEAETPRDLLRALQAAPSASAPPVADPAAAPVAAGDALDLPLAAETWPEVLDWHGERRPDAPYITFYQDEPGGEVVTYGELRRAALAVAAGLQARGLAAGEAVALMLPTGRAYFETFLGIWLAGGVPVPLYPPFRPTHIEDHLRRQAGILANCRARFLVAPAEFDRLAPLVMAQAPDLKAVVQPEALAAAAEPLRPRIQSSDIGLLQYTSGSTGAPKGVILSHANLLANVRAMGRALAARPDDVLVSWLPLYHDMGLIGAFLGTLYHGLPLVIMSPLSFVARPGRWLRALHRHRGTITAGPNFAYEMCLRRLLDADIAGLDLSSVRAVCNGAEAISVATMERFVERFAACGFRREAMMPVYGLAESTVGLGFPPLGRGPLVDAVDRQRLSRNGEAVAATGEGAEVMRVVSCGRPLPGHEFRVVDRQGVELPERMEGRIEFRGPSATSGYLHDAEATRRLFHGDWLDSGDLGYVADGELFVTGRAKDIIIKAGRNIYPEEIEDTVGALDGVRKGAVAVFGAAEPREGSERLVIVAESRASDAAQRQALAAAITDATVGLLGMPPDDVVLAPPNTVLKTSSGKIRRGSMRRLYEAGDLLAARRPLWRQVAALRLSALRTGLARASVGAGANAFAAWSWVSVGVVTALGWPGVVLLPQPGARWRLVRGLLGGLAAATRTPVTVGGIENAPAGAAVYVANHASYLDGFVLAATLPGRPAFVAKAELESHWSTALPLRRLGVAFVERSETGRSIAHARALAEVARAGRPLVFFAEGTFTRMPGLLPFRMGAFELAAELGLPVVPVALRGTRSILRAGTWKPRHGRIAVQIGPPIQPGPTTPETVWPEALRLRDETRAWLLKHTGEPDLAAG